MKKSSVVSSMSLVLILVSFAFLVKAQMQHSDERLHDLATAIR